MRKGISKEEFIASLSETVKLTRCEVDCLELKDDETVIVHYKSGNSKAVNIAMDSCAAIMIDVAKALM